MDAFVAIRTSIRNKLGRMLTTINKHNTSPLTPDDVVDLLEDLATSKKEFMEIQNDIIKLCADDADIDIQCEIAGKVEDKLRELRIKLLAIQRSLPSTSTSTSNQTNDPSVLVNVKLPLMNLPTFTGNYLEWVSFHDSFNHMVHDNSKISNCQKLHYLKASLRGDALGLISSLDITDQNYAVAWDMLKKRYENNRKIVSSHLKLLFGQPYLSSESSVGLRKLLDTTNKQIKALELLQQPVKDCAMLVFMIVERLDPESRKQWELHSPGKDFPKFDDLEKFLEDRCNALEEFSSSSKIKQHLSQSTSSYSKPSNGKSHNVSVESETCSKCKSSHFIYKCPEFEKMDVSERVSFIRKLGSCFNCLRQGHRSQNCASKWKCRKCNGSHHTMLHQENLKKVETSSGQSRSQPTNIVTHFGDHDGVRALLATAIVKVNDSYGDQHECRALLDSGSQVNLITDGFVKRAGLKRSRAFGNVKGAGQSDCGKVLGKVDLKISSHVGDFSFYASPLILSNVTSKLPSSRINITGWTFLEHLTLADPRFNEPSEVDLILGVDVDNILYPLGRIDATDKLPAAVLTPLGWVIKGSYDGAECVDSVCNFSIMDVHNQLTKFWEIEEVSHSKKILTQEELACESHFKNTHGRDSTGRYVSALPIKQNLNLGLSREMAVRRWISTEKRLNKYPQHKSTYHDFLQEYLDLGHMEPVPAAEVREVINKTNYLPHHFVIKESSTTTALRVVFDGSAKTTNGNSLNDCLMIGPRLQPDIFDILLRFRLHKYAFTADIGKMFRQIQIKSEHANLQRILWRKSPDAPLKDYRLLTVTYGTASGPYLATKSLQQLALDEGGRFLLAKDIVLRDFYVDDLMSGSNTIDSALEIQSQLLDMLKLGGFSLRKWTSNCETLLESLPADFRETKLPLEIDGNDSIKALGLNWNPAVDSFFYKVTLDHEDGNFSKRKILSDVAKLFDPLGLLAPVIIIGKMLFQRLWLEGLGWDDPIPESILQEWREFRNQLHLLESLKIPRRVVSGGSVFEIHGFCDASQRAYAAAIYIKSEDPEHGTHVQLLCSKAKVAPTKTVSLPRLELCGAVLLVRLIQKIVPVLCINIQSVNAWTDSTITLGWISQHPNKWTTFVANRVSEIQQVLAPEFWRHVRSEDNPADLGSRGVLPDKMNNHLWWNGPSWLKQGEQEWPRLEKNKILLPEEKSIKCHVVNLQLESSLLEKYSSLTKLLRVTSWIRRFISNSRLPSTGRTLNRLSVSELHSSLMVWIRQVQLHSFQDTIKLIKDNKSINTNLIMLNPFLDSNGLLRVGGRLSQSTTMEYDRKHPLLLPQKSKLVDLIIDHEHRIQQHAGPQLLLACLRRKYWIIQARRLIRLHVRKCLRCFRERAIPHQQQMGDLPSHRLEPARPFLHAGVDFGGPFSLKTIKGRGGKIVKSYLALFICCTTKAVHLEVVSDLSTDCFIMALKRFIARRGNCINIYSDNGTNFVGANNELDELRKLFMTEQHNNQLANYLAPIGTTWHFSPPRAPHFGGLWESGIKSAKQHLRKVIGLATLTFEEFYTVLTQIEACLNSRPLTPMSSDANDLSVLTAGHFLIGEPLTGIPEPDTTFLNTNRLNRFQLITQISQSFWRRWNTEYLTELQKRHKWQSKSENLKVGDMVLIKEDNIAPLKWVMARIFETCPGKDGGVRVVILKTSNGTIKRPITKLCLLPVEPMDIEVK